MSVVRKDGEKRRPMLSTFDGNNRQMLTEIRNSLSHLRKEDGSLAAGGPMQCRPDAAQYLAAAEGQMAAASAAKGTRSVKYTQKALAEIKQSLEGYQVSESSPAGLAPPNGYDVELQRVNEHHLRQLIQMGYDEDFAIRALKMSGNKSVDDALDTIHKLGQTNGFPRINVPGLTPYGTKVIRKPSFEEKYRTGSPVNSENSSVRSDSPVQGGATRGAGSANVQTSLVVPTVVGQRAECHTPPPLPPRGMHQVGVDGRGQTPPPPPQTFMGPTSYMDQRTGVVYQSYLDQRTGKHVLVPRQAYGAAGSAPVTPQRGMSPVMNSRHPVMMPQNMHSPNSIHGGVPQHGPGRPVQVNGRISGNSSPGEGIPMSYPMPPQMYYTVMSGGGGSGYNQLPIGGPEQSQYYILQSESSPLSSHSPSPAPTPIQGQGHVSPNQAVLQNPSQLNGSRLNNQPVPMHTWSTKQQPIFMHQAKSREVQKPVLQTATAPMSPPAANQQQQQPQHNTGDHFQHSSQTNYISSVHTQVNSSPHQHQQQQQMIPAAAAAASSHPSHPTHISLPGHPYSNLEIEITRAQGRGQLDHSGPSGPHSGNKPIQIGLHFQAGPNANNYPMQQLAYPAGCTPGSTPRSESPVPRVANQSPLSVISTTSTPSTSSDIPDKPPPPYPGLGVGARISNLQFINAQQHFRPLSPHQEEKLVIKHGPPSDDSQDSRTAESQDTELDDKASVSSQSEASSDSPEKHHCTSPKPQRRAEACMRDAERQETQVKHYSPQAFKFFIEQHMENVMNQHKQRELRRLQLEKEMARVDLSEEAQTQMRKMLYQKESNYIRLKRARMEKSMFEKIKTLGIGAFGEVALVRKRDKGHLYAMKTLRKRDVLSKNQVAHVKAERDILAEADNEWVVKLYYSFQDKNNLYFVMDYIPGGDMMSLLIKFGIFEEPLAQFYIAELVLAIESVHKMGFIHRDIKPDNILIDKDGHIKLTDFGLCTGFRWTHNSKYYQKGNHGRQDSMEPVEGWTNECNCDTKEIVLKPLERRKLRHQRCLAHSLVGTPNYIAPEVLLRSGYNKSCDWWSVGVILYEMLVGQPPFLANTPAETQLKVIHWESALNIPKEANLSPAACNIIVKLCCSPETRLGREDARELKRHPFFNGICFEDLRQQVAPYIPQIRSPTDTSHFDEVPQDKLRDVDSPEGVRKDAYENGKHPEHAFLEFTFRRFFDETGQMFMPRFPNEPFLPLPCMPDEHFISALPEEPELEQEESSESNTPVYV